MDRSGRELLSLGPQREFSHEALFYAGEDDFLAGTAAFVREGLDSDEPVLVVLRADKLQALRSALGAQADRVAFADMGEVGGNPGRIIQVWQEFVDRHSRPGGRLRGIGEPISSERSPAELIECQRHESLMNVAFADAKGFRLLCPYDLGALDEDVLEEARRSHPVLVHEGTSRASAEYRGLDEAAAPFAEPLPEPATPPESFVFQAGTLAALRMLATRHAARAGLTGEPTQDFVLAVNEVATNSVMHGGGGGIARIWCEEDAVICEIGDAGHIADPLAGRRAPTPERESGYGLWMANQLCDLVQVRSFAGGTAVRLHKRLP